MHSVRRAQGRSCLPLSISGNPFWPLEELRNLRNPPVVADPEFTPLVIGALGCQAKGAFASAPIVHKLRRQWGGARP
jgi:hypothetical protein